MKILFVIMLAGIMIMNGTTASAGGSCTFKGIPLKGRVKFVNKRPDIKIKIVSPHAHPDIRVMFVDSRPNTCGKWEIVEANPDLTVMVVDYSPDIKVQIVYTFPGMN